jgi:hypothetical protein
LVTAGLAVLLVLSVVPTYGVSHEHWQQVVGYVTRAARPNDCITFNKVSLTSDVAYYLSRQAGAGGFPREVLPSVTWSSALTEKPIEGPPQDFQAVRATCDRLWIVLDRPGPGDLVSVDAEVRWFGEHGLSNLSVSKFSGINVVLLRPR